MSKLTRRVPLAAVFGAMVLIGATACGDTGSSTSSGSGGDGGNGMSVTIKEPADGASIKAPFTLSLDSSVELGPTESGMHHVHLYFDGKDSQYEVIESADMEITDASPALDGIEDGEHEMNISLRNADHSAAGFETKIMVNVGGGGGGGGGGEQPPPPPDYGGGGGY